MLGVRAGIDTKPRPARGFVVFRWLVYALLATDVGLYAWHGTVTEVVDTAAWVVLLLLFEWETGGWHIAARARRIAHALRALASLVVVGSCVAYATQREWLDFANAATWLAVVLALELELRVGPGHRVLRLALRLALWSCYLALAGFIVAWLVLGANEADGAWLDAWDASLWLAAFVVIELNAFGLGAGDGFPARSDAFARPSPEQAGR